MRQFTIAIILLISTAWLVACASMESSSTKLTTKQTKILVAVKRDIDADLNAIKDSLSEQFALKKVSAWPLVSLNLHCLIYTVEASQDLDALFDQILEDKRIEHVQVVHDYSVLGKTYNDQHYALQYGARALQVDKAHKWSTGAGVKVAVIDTGIDQQHHDLFQSVKSTRNFVGKASDAAYPETHGTAIAGIIGAKADNQHGIVGIAPEAQIFGLRGCWQEGTSGEGKCNTLSLAKAIDYANIQDIKILNLSLQGPHDPIVASLLETALENGAVIVAAYKTHDSRTFPASLPGVIAVSDQPVEDSVTLMVQAPGEDVLTTIPNDKYELLQGSSLSAAHVTGIVALLRQHIPDISAKQIAEVLAQSSLTGGQNTQKGIVNACRALAAVLRESCS